MPLSKNFRLYSRLARLLPSYNFFFHLSVHGGCVSFVWLGDIFREAIASEQDGDEYKHIQDKHC